MILLKNHTTQVKKQKWIVALMKIYKIKKTPPPYKNMQDYIGSTTYKARESDDSPSGTDGCAINMYDEHKRKKMKNTLNLHLNKIIV